MTTIAKIEKKEQSVLENIHLLTNKLFILYDEGAINADGTLVDEGDEDGSLGFLNSILADNSYSAYKNIDDLKKDVDALKLACKLFV